MFSLTSGMHMEFEQGICDGKRIMGRERAETRGAGMKNIEEEYVHV